MTSGNETKLLFGALFILTIIATAALTALVAGGGSGSVSDDKLQDAIATYIGENPGAITAALENARAAQQQKQLEAARKNIKTKREEIDNDPATPVFGNPEGDVTIVEFFDYNCGYCKRMVPVINALLAEDKNLRFVFKEWPILGPASVKASRAAMAVHRHHQDKYFEFHQALMKTGARQEENIYAVATQLGIDAEQLKTQMEEEWISAQLEKHGQLAQSIGIRGTPAFIVNGELQRGAIDVTRLKQLIAAARG